MTARQISFYVHVPYCVSKCHYCDFYSLGVGGLEVDEEAYLGALERDLLAWKKVLNPDLHYSVRTLFLGGGTPSLFKTKSIERIILLLRQIMPCDEMAELSLEANPDTLTLDKIQAFKAMGVHRLSMGIQSLEDRLLAAIGRPHSARQATMAIGWAVDTQFRTLNIDLMYGLPGQCLQDLRHTLMSLGSYPFEHLSAYELTIEEETKFGKKLSSGALSLPSEDEVLEMRAELAKFVLEKGMHSYEISNAALDGHESLHNRHYWDYGSFVGLGAGAVSFLRRDEINQGLWQDTWQGDAERLYGVRVQNPKISEGYFDKNPLVSSACVEPISVQTAMGEFMMLGLRKSDGIYFVDFEEKFDQTFPDVFMEKLRVFARESKVEINSQQCYLTPRGILLSNHLLCEFV